MVYGEAPWSMAAMASGPWLSTVDHSLRLAISAAGAPPPSTTSSLPPLLDAGATSHHRPSPKMDQKISTQSPPSCGAFLFLKSPLVPPWPPPPSGRARHRRHLEPLEPTSPPPIGGPCHQPAATLLFSVSHELAARAAGQSSSKQPVPLAAIARRHHGCRQKEPLHGRPLLLLPIFDPSHRPSSHRPFLLPLCSHHHQPAALYPPWAPNRHCFSLVGCRTEHLSPIACSLSLLAASHCRSYYPNPIAAHCSSSPFAIDDLKPLHCC